MFQNEIPFPMKKPEVPQKGLKDNRKDALERLILELIKDPMDGDKSPKELIKPSRRAQSETRMAVNQRKLSVESDDGLLQRLKLQYFNSPEYTSAELREINSD
ncbi:hypothetical protein GCK32_020423 [Trichostrongylus colubriformis]|uniref:Uncharacterized protein n=1 Tax=Trichostrongylus colubriformis TaxID=6319 RepID=A0AAN8IMN1_TRICO